METQIFYLIYEGINLIYAEKMLNIEKLTASKCHHCWAYDFCDVCIRLADNNESNLAKNIACQCIKTKRELEETSFINISKFGQFR